MRTEWYARHRTEVANHPTPDALRHALDYAKASLLSLIACEIRYREGRHETGTTWQW